MPFFLKLAPYYYATHKSTALVAIVYAYTTIPNGGICIICHISKKLDRVSCASDTSHHA